MINKFFIKIFNFYQRYLSVLSFGSCRYYPTCSEYAKWQLQNDNIWHGLLASFLRILRCNKFFAGGIEYPIVKKNFSKLSNVYVFYSQIREIKFWFVPFKERYFFVIKTF